MPSFTFLSRSPSGCEDSSTSPRHRQRLRRRTASQTRAAKPLPSWLEWLNFGPELGLHVEFLNCRRDCLHGKMEDYVHLPDRHLLNPKPPRRPRRVEGVRGKSRELESSPSQQPANEADKRKVSSGSLMHSPEGSHQGAKPTKLPMPGTFVDRGRYSPKEKQAVVEHSKQAMARHIRPRRSSQVPDRDSQKAAGKDGEKDETKEKERLAKDTPSSILSKEKQKVPYHEAYRKIVSLASSSRQEIARHKLKYTGGNAKSAIPALRGANPNPKAEARPSVDSLCNSGRTPNNKVAAKGQGLSINTSDSLPQKYVEKNDTATDSSAQSYLSMSPVSQPGSSITDWEDRFVVNMPSAKDPNPPGLTEHQIRKFHQSIESVHQAGGGMLDPDSLPSPRTTSPEDDANHQQQKQKIGTFDGQESLRGPSDSEEQPSKCSTRGGYYCPEEVGKQRFSTIWEDASGKPERAAARLNPDGSFLGCKEINGPHDKNPDEILLFSTTEERPRVVDVPAPRFRTPREAKRAAARHGTTALEETNVQEEWRSISQNLKHAQCWKSSPKTMCRDTKCQPPSRPRLQGKGNSHQRMNAAKVDSQGPKGQCTSPDDVLIITPTITRSMMTMADMRAHAPRQLGAQGPVSRTAGEIIPGARAKHQMSSSPSGLRRATQNSWGVSNASSVAFSKPPYQRNGPYTKNRPDRGVPGAEGGPHTLSGYIRIPALVKSFRSSTENLAQSTSIAKPQQSPTSSTASSDRENVPIRSASDKDQPTKSPSKMAVSSIDTTVSQRDFRDVLPSSRIMEVAELDGQQVGKSKDTAPIQPRPTADISTSKFSKITNNDKAAANSATMGLLVEIIALSAAQIQTLYNQVMANRHSKATLAKIGVNSMLYMVTHCLRIIKDLLTAVSIWNTTGNWPRSSKKDLAASVTEIVQAVAYTLTLALIMVIVGRTAGYVVLIGSWVVWFARPFAWVIGAMGRALLG